MCSEKIPKNYRKKTALDCLFDKPASILYIFYRRLLQLLSMVFGPVKKSSENVYISLKTESKHQVP